MSQLLFLSVVDVLECSEEAGDALQISYHNSDADTQTPVQPTAYIIAFVWCLYWVSGKSKGNRKQILLEIRFFPSLHAYLLALVIRWSDGKLEIINWLICRGRFRGGQRRGNGSKLSIWDYPDLMGGIKRPMGGNPLSIWVDFVTLTCDVILQEPSRVQHATRWQYIQSGFYKGQGDVRSNFIFNICNTYVLGLNLYKEIHVKSILS